MIVKVCGMRDADNIRQVEKLGVDWIGMIFWPKSKRYVAASPAYLPTRAKRVGVFVDEDINEIRHRVSVCQLDFVQLHGHESPDYCRSLHPQPLIKAFNIAKAEDLKQTEPYEGVVDYFLFDTKGKSVGGNGEKFDWSVLSAYQGSTPFLLSGGIGPDDAEALRHFSHPKCIGIDLNSRFETEPAFKDINKLKLFLEQTKSR